MGGHGSWRDRLGRCGDGGAGDGHGDQHGAQGARRGSRRRDAARTSSRFGAARANGRSKPRIPRLAGAGEARRPGHARRSGVAAALDVQEHARARRRAVRAARHPASATRRWPSCCASTATALQAPNKSVEGTQHPDRNAQFEHINAKAAGLPRARRAGDLRRHQEEGAGRQLQERRARVAARRASPSWSTSTTFRRTRSARRSRTASTTSAPTTASSASASTTTRPVFAVTSIEAWWKQVGAKRYPDAREIFITADAGGSNSYRSHVWKHELQRLADKLDIAIRVSHFPPGTSKWNKVEHRLFSFISINWRGRPLRTYETVINLISQHHEPRRPRRARATGPTPLPHRQEGLREGAARV